MGVETVWNESLRARLCAAAVVTRFLAEEKRDMETWLARFLILVMDLGVMYCLFDC